MSALFDTTDYQIPFPKIDNKEVSEIALRLTGNLKLDRNNPEHVSLIESLTLGRYVMLNITASVDSKGQTIKSDDEVTYYVGLKLHSLEPANEAAA